MLIGLCGLQCSGKSEVAEYLVTELGFTMLEDPSLLAEDSHSTSANGDGIEDKSRIPSWQLTSQCWRPNINVVIRNIRPHDPDLPELLKRPYFLLVFVDSPLLLRFERAMAADRFSQDGLAEFAMVDDELRYATPSREENSQVLHLDGCCGINNSDGNLSRDGGQCRFSLSGLEQLSRLRLVNKFAVLSELYEELRTVNFTDPERLRPSWDTYFMSLAKLAAERTNCMKRRVGCVIARNKRMVATGYNGTPSGVKNCMEGGCGRCNGARNNQGVGLDLCLCLHAEENAIIEAGRERCEGGTLYTNVFPCILCSKKIVQSGISRIVFEKHYATDGASENLLRAGNVIVDPFKRQDVSRTLEEVALPGSKR